MATDIDQRLIDIQREYVDFLDDGVSAVLLQDCNHELISYNETSVSCVQKSKINSK